eukprot:TRINITY_DN11903_c0_g1_i1.p1 TRINITY_DN11903_c0_g1~~TRINITY_DN11903_c0_g1_i1.p1  ORF type:complete len:227 (-),score=48.79 TRINITY_DN11903_c0_g1_i1:278-916(-)
MDDTAAPPPYNEVSPLLSDTTHTINATQITIITTTSFPTSTTGVQWKDLNPKYHRELLFETNAASTFLSFNLDHCKKMGAIAAIRVAARFSTCCCRTEVQSGPTIITIPYDHISHLEGKIRSNGYLLFYDKFGRNAPCSYLFISDWDRFLETFNRNSWTTSSIFCCCAMLSIVTSGLLIICMPLVLKPETGSDFIITKDLGVQYDRWDFDRV